MKATHHPADALTTEDDAPLVVLPTGRLILSIGIVWGLYFLDFMARFGVNPLFPLIQKDLGLSDSEVGLLGSVVLLGMAVLMLPLAYLADRWSRSKLIALMALIWSACSIVSGTAQNFTLLLCARFGLGVGEASFAPTATSLLTSWCRRSRWGLVLGFFNTALSLGIFCGSVLSGYLGVRYGWRFALVALGLPGICLGLLALTIPDPKLASKALQAAAPNLSIKATAKMIAANRSLLLLIVFYGLINLGIVAVLSWTSMFYVRELGLPVDKAATLAGVTALMGVIGYPLGGYLSDLLARRDPRWRLWFPAAAALGVSGLFVAGFAMHSIALIMAGCFMFSLISPPLNAACQELVAPAYRSVAMGAVIFGMQTIGMAGPWLTGVLSMGFGLTTALMLMQVSFALASLGLLVTAGGYRRDCSAAREHAPESN